MEETLTRRRWREMGSSMTEREMWMMEMERVTERNEMKWKQRQRNGWSLTRINLRIKLKEREMKDLFFEDYNHTISISIHPHLHPSSSPSVFLSFCSMSWRETEKFSCFWIRIKIGSFPFFPFSWLLFPSMWERLNPFLTLNYTSFR